MESKVRNEDLDDFMEIMQNKYGDSWSTYAAKLAIVWYDKGERLQKKVDTLQGELDQEKLKNAGGLGE